MTKSEQPGRTFKTSGRTAEQIYAEYKTKAQKILAESTRREKRSAARFWSNYK